MAAPLLSRTRLPQPLPGEGVRRDTSPNPRLRPPGPGEEDTAPGNRQGTAAAHRDSELLGAARGWREGCLRGAGTGLPGQGATAELESQSACSSLCFKRIWLQGQVASQTQTEAGSLRPGAGRSRLVHKDVGGNLRGFDAGRGGVRCGGADLGAPAWRLGWQQWGSRRRRKRRTTRSRAEQEQAGKC